MPLNPSTSGTKALTTGVEWSIAQNAAFNAATPKTTTGRVTVWVDATTAAGGGAGPVAGDVIQLRVYRSIGGGTLTADEVVQLIPGNIWTRDVGLVGGNWDVSITLISATGRTLGFEVAQDIGDVNVATITAGAIAAASFAAGAITSTVLAAGAITSSIIAASAIGASQIAGAALTSAKFATDAIDATALSAAAVTKIQAGLALAASALSTAVWTNGRAALLDNADVAVSTRAPLVSAVSSADLTPTRAAKLDQLDAAVSSRATAADVTGAIAAEVSAIAAAAAAAVWGTVSEVGETAAEALRNIAARLLGSGTVRDGDGAYVFLSKDGSKTRVAQTRAGTVRTTTTRDGA